jgi:Glycosyl transferase family 2
MSTEGKKLRICILSGSARMASGPTFGLHQDSRILEQIIRESSVAGGLFNIESIEHTDPYRYGTAERPAIFADINIHLEVPCRLAWNYARINIVVVNQEWWYKDVWNWCLAPQDHGGADLVVFKSGYARSLFPEVEDTRAKIISWRAGSDISAGLSGLTSVGSEKKREFLYLIGASQNKADAARVIVRAWKDSWPPLHIYGSKAILDTLRPETQCAVELFDTHVTDSERIALQAKYTYHVVASAAEGFGYTFAEAVALGALPLWTDIGVYAELYGGLLGTVGKIPCIGHVSSGFRDSVVVFDEASVIRGMESLLGLTSSQEKSLRGALRHLSTTRIKDFRSGCRSLLKTCLKLLLKKTVVAVYPPRVPAVADFPHVAVVTLTHNRKRWFPNMAQNILKSDYPPDKMTWIVADDSCAEERVDTAVAKFQSANPYIRVRYVSLVQDMAIGAKRNKACLAAPPEASVFVMMDDDDHYPAGSIRARMAHLGGFGCVYCATLPMYDAQHYISAMNVPPLNSAPAERVSEASLAFTRAFFQERKFPASVSVAEGEAFIVGREHETAEISPIGVIVSFLHKGNSTSRRVPESTEPNGCHYGFSDEYFTFLSEVSGATD